MIGIIDVGSQKMPDIFNAVKKSGREGEIFPFLETDFSNKNWEKAIISGAPILLSQIDDTTLYVQQAKALLNLEIPLLGVCFGHQIIGIAHGASCFMGEEDRANQVITKVQDDPIFEGLDSEFEMSQDHCEYINLPEGFIHLGKSQVTEIEAMKHHSKPIYGCQFHPEVSGSNGLQFLKNFLKIN